MVAEQVPSPPPNIEYAMCRCCQNCWEDCTWNCYEERCCYDESIANYNPDEDEDYLQSQKNGGGILTQTLDNNNLTVPQPICAQPLRTAASMLMSNAKIHEDEYRRETQTNVPMLGPEILAVFANSQIFQDHQPTKLNRISTKTHLPIGSPATRDGPLTDFLTVPGTASRIGTDQERLVKRLEESLQNDDLGKNSSAPISHLPEKRITFTVASDTDSSSEGSLTALPTSHKFDVIEEEEGGGVDGTETPYLSRRYDNASTNTLNVLDERDGISDEVILRPRLIDRHPHLMGTHISEFGAVGGVGGVKSSRTLRSVRSVPHLNRSVASEIDIFSITGSGGGPISMTPEVPSISYSNLPKHYEDTPTIEKYRVSQSLFSIQVANEARATKHDYSMPRYFRRSAMVQSTEAIPSAVSSTASSTTAIAGRNAGETQKRAEKSKRLQMLRGNLPPLLIHSVSFRKNRDDKQLE